MRRKRERDPIVPDYSELFGDKTGLVKSMPTYQFDRAFPPSSLTLPVTCNVEELVDGHDDLEVGGKGATLREAFLSSLGEAMERISHLYPDPDATELASHRAIERQGRVIDWEYLDVYNDAVKGDWVCEISPETPICWTTGTDLLTGESVSVPADLVWQGASQSRDDWSGPPPFLWTSTGSAAGPSFEAAVLGGIYEILERDAFVRVWSRQETPPALSLDDAPALRRLKSTEFDHGHFRIELIGYESPVDVPVVSAVLRNEREEVPYFVMAGGSHVDPAEAVRDALYELTQIFTFFPGIADGRIGAELDMERREKGFGKTALYYSRPENFEEVSFLLEGEPRSLSSYPDPDVDGVSTELGYCLRALERAGCTPIAVDVTTTPIREVGAKVVKVVVPELLDYAPQYAVQANHPVFDGEEVTTKPHPFP